MSALARRRSSRRRSPWWRSSSRALALLLAVCSTSTTAHRSRRKAQFSPSLTPINHLSATIVLAVTPSSSVRLHHRYRDSESEENEEEK
ncbi:hypothetical protein PIB30_015052 [Stylosanthes scabra]|uniref:Secreted protein n=1 Tax=Stylosanthes scabra TaxID=79078 RepID=A0ABU6Z6D0_9FABA|nr:hypothetical protein [Stylosanthes scabra]